MMGGACGWVKYAPTEAGRRSELHSHTLAKEDNGGLWLFVKKQALMRSGAPVWDDQDTSDACQCVHDDVTYVYDDVTYINDDDQDT